jgi:NAD(P)-dependent dehydrogenase (short-subunit alcohol dehydrogenase family)
MTGPEPIDHDPSSGSLFSVAGKRVVITGGSRGIGEMMATGLVRAGAHVYIVGRHPDVLAATAERLSALGTCVAIPADIGTEEGARQVAAAYGAAEGELHALINNAGTAWAAPLEDYPLAQFNKVLSVNLTGPFLLTSALLPLLRAGADAADPARIINIGSTDGTLPPRLDTFAYSASKAGLHMLTRHLAYSLRAENIRVNAVAPGLFETKMTAFQFRDEESTRKALAEIPVGRSGTPDDAAGIAVFLCSRASAYITGAIVPVDGGYAAMR